MDALKIYYFIILNRENGACEITILRMEYVVFVVVVVVVYLFPLLRGALCGPACGSEKHLSYASRAVRIGGSRSRTRMAERATPSRHSRHYRGSGR